MRYSSGSSLQEIKLLFLYSISGTISLNSFRCYYQSEILTSILLFYVDIKIFEGETNFIFFINYKLLVPEDFKSV